MRLKKERLHLIDRRKNWPRLKKYLHKPLVEEALDAGMRVWCRDYAYLPREEFDPKKGPWWYSSTDYWCDQKRPKKDTPDWYRCVMGCHWLRGFACALGQLAFPHFDWFIVGGKDHSTSIGFGRTGIIHVFDPLQWHRSARETLEWAGWPNKCRMIRVEDEIVERRVEYREYAKRAA